MQEVVGGGNGGRNHWQWVDEVACGQEAQYEECGGQPLFRIDIEALHTDKAIAIDGPQELYSPKELMQAGPLYGAPAHPFQYLHRGPASILTVLMRPVARRIEGLDGALQTLVQQPYGPWLLGIVALGLVSFGIYSLLCAKWIHVIRS